jgi:copper transport protein
MTRPAATRATSCAGRRSRRRPALQAVLQPLLLLVALLAFTPGVASAHAQLVAVDPPDGAIVATSPAAVSVTFNEPIGLATGGLRVIDSAGAVVDQGEDVVDGPTVSQPLPPLPDGWYVVTWGIVSEDGHIVRASSVFGVGDADAAARPTVDAGDGSLITGIARFATDLGMLVATGAWAAWWLLRARIARVRRLAWGATALALAGTVAWGLIESGDGGATWMATPAATLTIMRGVLLAIALVPAGVSTAVPAGSVVLALLTLGGGGHSSGDPFGMALLAAHLLAAIVWLGAAPAVFLTLRSPALDDVAATDVVRRFSRLAAIALLAIAAAGAALTWNLSDGLAGGLTSPWMLTLGGKIALVGAAAVLGFAGRRHLGGQPDRGRLTRLFLVDAGILVGVAVLSSMLTLTSPHVGHVGHQGHVAGSARCAMVVGDGSVSVIAAPGRVGTNTITLGGLPADALSVTLDWRHELTEGAALRMDAESGADGWTATGVLPLAGEWALGVAVRVDTFTQQNGSCTLTIGS